MSRTTALALIWTIALFGLPHYVNIADAQSDSAGQRANDGSSDDVNLERVRDLIVQRTNEFREEHGLRTLETNQELAETAQYFAEYMAQNNVYGHYADGNRPSERARAHGYEFCIVSENIAFQYSSVGFSTRELARRFVEGWKESPEHRKNMLDEHIYDIGIGVAQSAESGRYYAVQMFGRPKSKQIQFMVSNRTNVTASYEVDGNSFSLPPRVRRTHSHCRPPELTLHLPTPEDADTEERTRTFHPDSGDHYRLVRDQSGSINVRQLDMPTSQDGS